MNSMESTKEWLKFDIQKIIELKEDYALSMQWIQESLPLNITSRKEIINYFESTFQIQLNSIQIKEVTNHLQKFKEESEEFEVIKGIIYYLKMKYAIKNYLDTILRHEVDGVVQLREFMGEITLPNRQKLPYSIEIIDAIVTGSPSAMAIITHNKEKTL